jgi:hypothetical protein
MTFCIYFITLFQKMIGVIKYFVRRDT